jgi:RNA 2',3'-cyclic 3'-phosphodiesterase
MRLFIALESKELESYFRELQKKIPGGASLAFTNSFHLTLKFLGEVEEKDLGRIKEALSSVEFREIDSKLSNMGVFPSEKYLRVVWIGLSGAEEIIRLQESIEKSLSKMFRKEKDFTPHITLARVKLVYPEKKESFVSKLKQVKVEPLPFRVSCFRLIRSTLAPGGSIYEELAAFGPKPL